MRTVFDMFPELKDFDYVAAYPYNPETGCISHYKQSFESRRMGRLMAAMTLRGAEVHELCDVIRHSNMLVDAEKFRLDWKRSEKENHIKEYVEKYMNGGRN